MQCADLSAWSTPRETITLPYTRGMRQTALDASAKIAEALVVGGRTGYREKFYLYGFFGILDEWVKRRFTEAPEEVAAMLDGLNGLMQHAIARSIPHPPMIFSTC